jgi:uncharacterized lipoprotein YddW (UPF0748 family)
MKTLGGPRVILLVALAGLGSGLAPVGCRLPAGGPEPAPGIGARPTRAAPLPMPRPVRAIWVARFHYRYPDDVRTIIQNCAAIGCNTVYWQVRGEGTVTYPSRIEPWSREFDYRDPGFDPLALAVAEAHRHGLRIEAWFNVLPGWKGPTPPPVAGQLYQAHPEWFLYDATGRRQPLNENYVIVNPCWPEVRRHIASVADEIVSRYDVDGIHLDYVRYAWDGSKNAKQSYPRDARTLALYRRETGLHPDDDPAAWHHWRANQLTRVVSEIRVVISRRRPGATLTAAVWRDPELGYRDYLQNSVAWLRTGLLDAAVPMAYTEQVSQLEADIGTYRRLASSRRIIPGLGLYLHKSPEQTRDQLRRCLAWGGDFALFSYDSMFPTAGDRSFTPQARAEAQRQRLARREVLNAVVGQR